MAESVNRAAANNARWCDLVCRAAGLAPRFDDASWSSPVRTPEGFPDAVTLAPDLDVDQLLAQIDSSPGCSIKDSYAQLDLFGRGFRVLFDAQWIAVVSAIAPSATAGTECWEVIDDGGMWRETSGLHSETVHPLSLAVLAHEDVTMLGARCGGRVLAGAVATNGSGVIGISNFFVRTGDAATHWRGAFAHIGSLHPSIPIVGYETGDMLSAALQAGCEPTGTLRVWLRE